MFFLYLSLSFCAGFLSGVWLHSKYAHDQTDDIARLRGELLQLSAELQARPPVDPLSHGRALPQNLIAAMGAIPARGSHIIPNPDADRGGDFT